MITDEHHGRTSRFREEGLLPAPREAFGQRSERWGFDAHQLSAPPEDPDVEEAIPFPLEDREGAA